MDIAIAVAAATTTITTAPKPRNPTTPLFKRRNLFNLHPSHSAFPNPQIITSRNPRNPHGNRTLRTHCSTNPTVSDDKDNVIKDQDLTIPHNPNLNPENPQKPTSNQPKPTSNSSLSRGLVLDLGSTGSWDDLEIGSPVVKRFLSDEEERWHMWYHGRGNSNPVPGSSSIGLAVSSNGVHWERGKGVVQSGSDVGLVLKSSNDWWGFDTNGVMPGEVMIMSSSKNRASNAVYWLYYTGFSNEKIEFLDDFLEFSLKNPKNGGFGRVCRSLVGLAMSQDGRHWARIEGDHHSGSLFGLGSESEWDSKFIASPHVVFHGNGDLRMFYHSFDASNGCFAIGVARSRDGMRWVKLGKVMGGGQIGNFDEYGVKNPCVVRKKDGGYLMVYEGVGVGGDRAIGLARSPDGLKDWVRVGSEPVLEKGHEGGCWDDAGVGSPFLVRMEGEEDEWRLYYSGIGKNGQTGIGMVVSEGKEVENFRRWTGFRV